MRRDWRKMLYMLPAGFAAAMIFAIGALAARTVYADSIPEADIFYDADIGWDGTLTLDHNCTVKINGVTHSNEGTVNGAVIKIIDGAVVNLVFEGTNVLTANSGINGAGIEVETGATVNIYGMPGSELKVTGGYYGAGIGGIGYKSVNNPNEQMPNPPAGNINIYSGKITAIGGSGGAGIGSGYHSSAAQINIRGGDITALGTSSGAGIGSGYGTSGGSGLARVGTYDGGSITISGGTVRAASWQIDFSKFDPYDPATMRGEGYSNTFAAGIGGGYGASSGTIIIEGSANVTALGSCGGAGIGTGRGTSTKGHYDEERAFCDVTIRGDAVVTAIAAADDRANFSSYGLSGAGIGLGMRWNLTGTPGGKVRIEDNASVYALTESGANGIGGSIVVNTTEDGVLADTRLKTLAIGENCTVTAVCLNKNYEYPAFNESVSPSALPAVELAFDESFFAEAGVEEGMPFFKESMFPVFVDVREAGSTRRYAAFALTEPGKIHVGIHLPKADADKASYLLRDYRTADDVGVLLARSDQDGGWQFDDGLENVTHLLREQYGIIYHLNEGSDTAGNPAAYFVYGPAVSLADPERRGFDFCGWYADETFAGDAVKEIPAGSVGDKQLWAKWEKIYYTVAFEDGQGNTLKTEKVEFEGAAEAPDGVTRDGYTFKGWDKEFGKVTANMTVTAVWEKIASPAQEESTAAGTEESKTAAPEETTAPTPETTQAPQPEKKVSGTLIAKMTASGKTSLILTWNKVTGAEGYDVFFVKCGKEKPALVKSFKGNKTFRWKKTKLKKKTAYKAFVKAYVTKNGKKKYVLTSPRAHVYTSGGTDKYTNAKSVKLAKSKVTLKKGGKYKIKATVNKTDPKKELIPEKHTPQLRYISSNKKIATVSSAGRITAKAAGSCKVYVIAANGAKKTVTVTVR